MCVCVFLSSLCRVDATVVRHDALKKRLSDLEESNRATGKLEEKMADLHKRFQTVTTWKPGKVCSLETNKSHAHDCDECTNVRIQICTYVCIYCTYVHMYVVRCKILLVISFHINFGILVYVRMYLHTYVH